MRTPHIGSGGRYPVLRAVAILYLIMAVVALAAGIVGAGWALLRSPWGVGDRIVLALLVLAGSFFMIVGSLAVAEIIKLFVDMEHNTRVAAGRALGENTAAPAAATHNNRLREFDEEETAEGALLRGH